MKTRNSILAGICLLLASTAFAAETYTLLTGDVNLDRCLGKKWSIALNVGGKSSRSDLLAALDLALSSFYLKPYDSFAVQGTAEKFLYMEYRYRPDLVDVRTGAVQTSDELAFLATIELLKGLKEIPGVEIQCRGFLPVGTRSRS